MKCRTSQTKGWLLAAAVALLASPLFSQTCLQDVFTADGNSQSLNCTANDVRVAKVVNVRDPLTGKTLDKCQQGTNFNFIADFEIVTSSTSSRSNIGLYFASQGQGSGLTGTCVDNIVAPLHQCPGAAAGILCGSDNYHELDPSPDSCGDTSSTDNSPVFGSAAEGVTIEVDGFKCEAPAGQTGTPHLVLPNCTSWQVPGKTLQCQSPAPNYPFQNTAIPGSPSKCNCGTIDLPIQPVNASAIAQKACTTTNTPGPATFTQNPKTQSPVSCDAGPEGSTVTYTVAITNTTQVGDLIVDQICDTIYGTIYDDGTGGFAPCAPGSATIDAGTTCTAANLDIAQGATKTCTFTAKVGENVSGLTDTITTAGHSALNTSSHFTQGTNSVTVTSTDAPSSAKVTKGFVGTEAGCATVRYSVVAHNSSGADETLSLSKLTDTQYGDISKLSSGSLPVLGTTCGVAAGSPGLGTLSGVTASATNGGAFPASLPAGGADYQCQFDGQFCSALDNNSCISLTDSISGTIVGDEGEAVTQTFNTINVKECFSATVTPQ